MTDRHQSWLASILLEQPGLLDEAAALLGTHPDDGQRLAARRVLDQRIRPRWHDYALAAGELADGGHAELAGVLRAIADDDLLGQALSRWQHRYAYRPETERDVRADPDARDGIDWGDDGPRRGIDGAWYECGHLAGRNRCWWVTEVDGRGHREHVVFAEYELQRRWVADRGETATGELIFPDVSVEPRVVQEEKILAGLLADPGMVAGVARFLPPETFTADARYEIYSAMLTLAIAAARYGWDFLPEELDRRAAWLPDRARAGSPRPYLERLADTPVSRRDGKAAIRAVAAEDARARALNGWYHAVADPVTGKPVSAPAGMPDAALRRPEIGPPPVGGERSLSPPRPARPGPDGPVPRM